MQELHFTDLLVFKLEAQLKGALTFGSLDSADFAFMADFEQNILRYVRDEIDKQYARRATVPGTLIIAEATFITPKNAGLNNWRSTPGAWSVEQIAGWKKVVYPLYKLASMLVFIDVILDRRRRACARLFHISPIMGHRS